MEVVVGAAGTGKTFALDAARTAWEAAGRTVVGCALAARAAAELEAGAGICSHTLASLLGWLETGRLNRGTVVVVDEAGMVGTLQLTALLRLTTAAGAKLVLVGDHRQLPEIEAGGMFRALQDRLGAVELTENRRQTDPLAQDALAALRAGQAAAALERLDRRGGIVVAPGAEALRERMVAEWLAAHLAGENALMLALTRADVVDLNGRARAALVAAGRVEAEGLRAGSATFAVGDRVVALRNRRALGVLNGSVGTVVALDEHRPALHVELDTGRRVVLPQTYVRQHLGHGYASTVHKAQGRTVDRSFLLGDEHMYLEAGYTALSRGRTRNAVFAVGTPDGVREALSVLLARARAKHIATIEPQA